MTTLESVLLVVDLIPVSHSDWLNDAANRHETSAFVTVGRAPFIFEKDDFKRWNRHETRHRHVQQSGSSSLEIISLPGFQYHFQLFSKFWCTDQTDWLFDF